MTAAMSPLFSQPLMGSTMNEGQCRMTNDLFKSANNVSEAQAWVRLIAWRGCEPGESVKAALRRVAHATGLPHGQIRRYWYGLPSRIDAWALDLLRAKTGNVRDAQKQLAELRRRHVATVQSDDQLRLELDRLPPHSNS